MAVLLNLDLPAQDLERVNRNLGEESQSQYTEIKVSVNIGRVVYMATST